MGSSPSQAGSSVLAHELSSCGMRAQELHLEGLAASLACGILVPTPGIEPASPALQSRFSTPGPPRESDGEVLNHRSLCFVGSMGLWSICWEHPHPLASAASPLPCLHLSSLYSGCFSKMPQSGEAGTTDVCSLTVLRTEVRSQDVGRVGSSCSTRLSLAVWWVPGGSVGVSWLLDTSPRPLPSSSHGGLSRGA